MFLNKPKRTKSTKSLQYGASTATTIDFICARDCTFCQAKQKFTILITKALYIKYSASQNYFYQKDVNLILNGQRSKSLVQHKEIAFFQQNEYLRRFYSKKEAPSKLDALSEYYKFHRDVPRLFMLPVAKMVSKYHDRRRRIDYLRITKMLGGKIEQPTNHESIQSSLQNLLANLNFTKQKSVEQSNTLIDIQRNLKDIIASDNPYTEQSERIFNLPLQIKNLDFNQIEKNNFKKKPIQSATVHTHREHSQPKQFSTEKSKVQVPATYRNTKRSISPKQQLQIQSQRIKPTLMQLMRPISNTSNSNNHNNKNNNNSNNTNLNSNTNQNANQNLNPNNAKMKCTNLILECLMKKLNLDVKKQQLQQQQQQQQQKSKSPIQKRKKRVMSTNNEAPKQGKQQLTFRKNSGRSSVQQ